ncbi:MAG TPA: Spy/CpxP family protein refolding chaperone [Bryobacteraceae bacterium]|nr:Spy/CpxP family protein refolding chaperone [Bryobacteraceae bacterium]
MNPFRNRFAAWTAVAALSAASLFAAPTSFAGHRHGRMGTFLTNYLNLTASQQAQRKSIFETARQSSQPVRQELRQTRKSLHAAIQSDNTAQIQQLAKVEGTEVGQLSAIRADAMAKSYKILTPAQRQKLASLREAWQASRRPAHRVSAD